MKIAIVGAGNIGGTLGKKWAHAGRPVVFGVRDVGDPKTIALLAEAGGNASADTVPSAIRQGDVVVFAVPGAAVAAAVAANAAALDGRILIDAANKFGTSEISSVAAMTAAAPGASVFRAFNSVGWENLAEPRFGDLQADMLYCGPADETRTVVEAMIADIGLNPVYVGGLDQVALVDNLGALWVALAFGQGKGRRLAFKLLTP
jgi:8-hydroxy-5-deazaflavin:NADPH oxidoreductase